MLYFLLLFYIASVSAWWRDDDSTGYLWNEAAPVPASYCGTSPSSDRDACCPSKQEPATSDRTEFISKSQIALPDQPYVGTFLQQEIKTALCPVWKGTFYGYSGTTYLGQIGSATMRWGGQQGTCLLFKFDVTKNWLTYSIRIGSISMGSAYTAFPPLNGGEWYQGSFVSAGTEYAICPLNPGSSFSGYTPTPGPQASAQFPLPGCYQAAFVAVNLKGFSDGTTDAWLVPNQVTTVIPTSIPGSCPDGISVYNTDSLKCDCPRCIANTDCCADPTSPLYGICKSSAATNCPAKPACSGGNCPDSLINGIPRIQCIPVDEKCLDGNLGKFCWGKLACHPTAGCPTGYLPDMFCYANGNSGGMKVCCSIGVSYTDFTATSTPSCTDYCWAGRYRLAPAAGTPDAGFLRAQTNGGELLLSYKVNTVTLPGYSISQTRVWIGPNTLTASSPTPTPQWNWVSSADFIETPYDPVPTLEEGDTSIAVNYDILRAIAVPSGLRIACGTNFAFTFEATLVKAGSPNVVVSLPATAQDRVGIPYNLLKLTNGPYVATALRCCYDGNTDLGDQCAPNAPCSPTNKFMDNFKWTVPGIEFQTDRCCAVDRVLDNVLQALPEAVDNSASLSLAAKTAKCINPTGCTMAWSYLYESTNTRSVLGYIQLQSGSTTAIDTTKLSGGYGYIFPDVSSRHSSGAPGCLVGGDTMTVSVPFDATIGWYIAPSSWSTKAGTTPTGVKSSIDSTARFGAYSFGGVGGVILAVEDGSDNDFNDAIFGIKLNPTTGWQMTGLATDRCTGVVSSCSTFAPYSYAAYVFKPECRPFIPLDIGVGTTSKDVTNFYAIPDGWEIAPMDALAIKAITNYGESWVSTCFIGVSSPATTPVTYVGLTAAGTACSGFQQTWVKTQFNPDGSASLCYTATNNGQILLRQKQIDPFCSVNNYGEYCSPTAGGTVTVQPASNEPSSVWVNLVAAATTQVPFYIPVLNEFQVYVLIDTFNTVSSPNNEILSMQRTLPYLFAELYSKANDIAANIGAGWQSQWVNYGTTTSTGTYNTNCIFATRVAQMTPKTATSGCTDLALSGHSTANTILPALTSLLLADQASFGWRPTTARYVYVPTKDSFASVPAAQVTAFASAMSTSGIYVVFVPTVGTAVSALRNLVTANNIPRVAVSNSVTWPSFSSNTNFPSNTILGAASGWLTDATTARKTLDGRFTFKKLATPVDTSPEVFVLNSGPFVIPGFGSTLPKAPVYQFYSIPNVATGVLPALPQRDTIAIPRIANWEVTELLSSTYLRYTFSTYAFWNQPPSLLLGSTALVYSFTDTAPAPYLVKVMDAIISSSDPNFNRLDVKFSSSVFSSALVPGGGSVWPATAVGYLGTSSGANIYDAVTGVKLETRYNMAGFYITPKAGAYGSWTLKYTLTDGCASSPEGTLVINFFRTQSSPSCKDFSATTTVGTGVHPIVDFSTLTLATNLGSCTPSKTITGTCPTTGPSAPTGCTSCYLNTRCCAVGTGSGTCGIPAQTTPSTECPAGAPYLCSGNTCPTALSSPQPVFAGLIQCIPSNPTACTGTATCLGSTKCGSSGCPDGYQEGLFCVYQAGSPNVISICCSQLASNNMEIAINDDKTTIYGPVNRQVSGSWNNPIQYINYRTDNSPLQFQLTAGAVPAPPENPTVWNYNARFNGKVASCKVTINVLPPNRPPTITLTQTITTPATNTPTVGTWNIEICDQDVGDTLSLFFDNPNVNWNTLSGGLTLLTGLQTSPVQTVTYAGSTVTYDTLKNAASAQDYTLFTGQALAGTPNCAQFTMQWAPLTTHSQTIADTFELYVTDNIGSSSSPIVITLKVPANTPPVWRGDDPVVPANYNRNSPTDLPVTIWGNDGDQAHTDVLTLTFTSLPDPQLGILKYNGIPVTLNTPYPPGETTVDGKTSYGFTFDPAGNLFGTVTIGGFFTDLAGATGPGTISFVLPKGPVPPTTQNVDKTTTKDVPVDLTVPFFSDDGKANGLMIESISLRFPAKATFKYNGAVITVGQIIIVTPETASGSLTFTYLTSQNEVINDFFTYRALDSRSIFPDTSLRSAISTGTVTGPGTPIPNIPPRATGGAVTTPFNTPVTIPILYNTMGGPITYSDPDGDATNVVVTITTLPVNGKLFAGGNELTIGSVVPANSVNYVPGPTYQGTDSFIFTATDRDGAKATATVTITVLPKPIPPTLTIVEDQVTVYRTQPGTFTVNVEDGDSRSLKIYITGIQIPFGPTDQPWTTAFEISKCLNSACNSPQKIETYTVTKNPTTNELILTADVPPPVSGLKETGLKTFRVTWTPSAAIPDGTTGQYKLYVVDPTGLSSEPDTGLLNVIPNRQPVINDNPSGPSFYSFPDKSTDSPSFPVTLFSTDPDSWDTDKLTYIITGVPTGSFFLSTDGCVTAISSVPATVGQTSNVPGTSSTGTVTVCPTNPPAGTQTFTFVTIDPLGKQSAPQTVTITFKEIQDPPITGDQILYVYQDSKYFGLPATADWARIDGSDPDPGQTDKLRLVFTSLPTSAQGKLGFFPPATTDLTEVTTGVAGAAYRPAADWKYWFEPAPGVHSSGCPDLVKSKCNVFATAKFYVEDDTTVALGGPLKSVEHTLFIYVIPINTPPRSQNLVFRIPMNSELVVSYSDLAGVYNKLPASDDDNTDAEISANVVGLHPDNVGAWFTKSGSVPSDVSELRPTALPDRYLSYKPPTNAYSSPKDQPLGHLFFNVYDLQPLYSTFYSVQVFVDYVPPKCLWKGPKLLVAREDTDYKINLINADNYANELNSEVAFTLLTGPQGAGDKGYFFVCPGGVCAPIDLTKGAFKIPSDGFYYHPPENANGKSFTKFTFSLELLDPNGKSNPASVCDPVDIVIDVDPVNDPPNIIPLVPTHPPSSTHQQPITATGWEGDCDENTDTFPDIRPYYRLRFRATDIDNTNTQLRAQTVTLIEKERASLYVCGPKNQVGGTGSDKCDDGKRITSLEFIDQVEPGIAEWEISFVIGPHWNSNFGGKLSLGLVIWDNDVFTPVRTFKLRVWPINDYPTIVEGSTSVLIEVYEHDTAKGTFKRLNKDGGEAGFTIHTPERFSALREDLIPGEVLETNTGREANPNAVSNAGGAPVEQLTDEEKKTRKEVNVYRMRCEVQDAWDFTFGIPVNFTGTLIRASWAYDVEESLSQKRAVSPCAFKGPKDGSRREFGAACFVPAPGGIVALNNHLKTNGLPFFLEKDTEGNEVRSCLGVFMIADLGNVDKLNRPLAGGFTIEFTRPGADDALAVPIAALVILPVIAAATAALIAAAWILLGQRAQEYAGASFDAFSVVASNGGNKSPLYDDLGREVHSPLYNGNPGKAF